MKKILLSLFVIFTFGFYAIYQRQTAPMAAINSNTQISLATIFNTKIFSDDDDDDDVKIPTPNPISTSVPTKTSPNVQYKNGTYTGKIVDAYYGNIQVQVVISGGKLTDVNVLDYPQDRDTSRNINAQALPILKSEAIQAQSAQIDAVSGASATSPAFIESLGSALALAKN